MEKIINNEISNSKSVQILRAEQTLESSMKRGGTIMSTMKNTMNGTTTNNGGKAMTKAAILRQLKEEFPELEINELKEMAQEEYEAQFETTQQLKTEEKKQEAKTEEDEMDKFLEFMYKEVTARGAVTSKVASTLIYKYVDKYGADIDKVARYTAAFINYFVTDEGEKHARRVGWDILMLLGAQLGKNLVSEFDTLVDLIEIGETVVKYKTGLDTARAVVGAYKYAKKNQENITNELLEYGNKQRLTSMAFSAIDELMDQE